jgi:hypothetical protein
MSIYDRASKVAESDPRAAYEIVLGYDPGPDPLTFKAFLSEMRKGAETAEEELAQTPTSGWQLRDEPSGYVQEAADEIIALMKRIQTAGYSVRVTPQRFAAKLSGLCSKLVYNLGKVEGYSEGLGKFASSDGEEVFALLPETEEAVGTPAEDFKGVNIISKLLYEIGKLALETSRAIRQSGANHSQLLNQVFLPAAVSKLFTIARKSKNIGLMTTLRRLMASDDPVEVAKVDPKAAFEMILAGDQGDQGEEDTKSKGPPPKWKEFVDQKYEGGKKKVRNPNRETVWKTKQVTFNTAIKDKGFRQHIMENDYSDWLDDERRRERSEKAQAKGK